MIDGFKFEVGQRVQLGDETGTIRHRFLGAGSNGYYGYTVHPDGEPELVEVVRWEDALRPLLTRHEFGVVVFEETGEKRPPRAGEWFAGWPNSDLPMFCKSGSGMDSFPRIILRPVEIKR
jgi:hypothetical protein